jgi:hypothetical protein
MLDTDTTRALVERAFADRSLLADPAHRDAVFASVAALDDGSLRVAEPTEQGWVTHAWIKQAILLFFALQLDGKDRDGAPSSFTTRSRSRRGSTGPACGWCLRGSCATAPSSSPRPS